MLPIALSIMVQMTAPLPAEVPVAPYAHSDANAGATPFAGTAMWHAFHGQAGVDRIIDGLIDRSIVDKRCGSACKRDPLSGVIGVQKGPLISMV